MGHNGKHKFLQMTNTQGRLKNPGHLTVITIDLKVFLKILTDSSDYIKKVF